MAKVTNYDPNCISTTKIISVGTVRLTEYKETDSRYQSNPATLELAIDVIAPPSYESVTFFEIILILEISQPTGAQFVEHSGRGNYSWGVPDPSKPDGWAEAGTGAATRKLRLRTVTGKLFSGPGNGLTHKVGIRLPANDALKFTALASAKQVEADASSCKVEIADLSAGDVLTG